MALAKTKSLTIACKAMNPFVTRDLLKRTANGVEPISGAAEIRIKDTLGDLNDQDKRFGLNVIDNILETTASLVSEEGYFLVMGKGLLLTRVTTLGSLAAYVRANSGGQQ